MDARELESQVVKHFELMADIQQLKHQDDEVKRAIVGTLTKNGMHEFFSINWRKLHREFVGGPVRGRHSK